MTSAITVLPPITRDDERTLRALIREANARGLVQTFATLDVALAAIAPPTERERLRALILERTPEAATRIIVYSLVPSNPALGLVHDTLATFLERVSDGQLLVHIVMTMGSGGLGEH